MIRSYLNKYVLITAAKNEEAAIEKTINSVLLQDIVPLRWVIVSDGSTDRTDEIVENTTKNVEFVTFLKRNSTMRSFSSKVKAINQGYESIKELEYDFIGILDADIVFENCYYKSLMEKFAEYPKLGISGGVVYVNANDKIELTRVAANSVPGAIQFFRRECFEQIGGLIAMDYQGEDAAAEIIARMKGWDVFTFPDLWVEHYGEVLSGSKNLLLSRYKQGVTNYVLGYHPLFEVISSFSRFFKKPFILGTFWKMSGYFWAAVRRLKKVVPLEVVEYLRKEQLSRLKHLDS